MMERQSDDMPTKQNTVITHRGKYIVRLTMAAQGLVRQSREERASVKNVTTSTSSENCIVPASNKPVEGLNSKLEPRNRNQSQGTEDGGLP
jgi:hypothetical protein